MEMETLSRGFDFWPFFFPVCLGLEVEGGRKEWENWAGDIRASEQMGRTKPASCRQATRRDKGEKKKRI